jgi:hypothetical protein
MNFERAEQPNEDFPKISEAMVANMVQLRLMTLAFRFDHGGVEVDMSNRETRNQVGAEWTEKYAGAFREYIEDHPRETVNLHDEEALMAFLMKIKEYSTIH